MESVLYGVRLGIVMLGLDRARLTMCGCSWLVGESGEVLASGAPDAG
jgi:hypothetical protein